MTTINIAQRTLVTTAVNYIINESDDIEEKYKSLIGKRCAINTSVDSFDTVKPDLLKVSKRRILHRNALNTLVKASNSLSIQQPDIILNYYVP